MINVKFYNSTNAAIYQKESKVIRFIRVVINLIFFAIMYYILFKKTKFRRMQKFDLNQWKSSLKLLKKKKKIKID